MSGTPEGVTALQSAPGLQQFNVKYPFKTKRLGTGSYGSVDELVVGGIICSVVLVWLHIIRFSFSKKAVKERKFSFSFS